MINYFIVHYVPSDANKWVIDLFDMKVLPDPKNRIKTFVTYAFYTSN